MSVLLTILANACLVLAALVTAFLTSSVFEAEIHVRRDPSSAGGLIAVMALAGCRWLAVGIALAVGAVRAAGLVPGGAGARVAWLLGAHVALGLASMMAMNAWVESLRAPRGPLPAPAGIVFLVLAPLVMLAAAWLVNRPRCAAHPVAATVVALLVVGLLYWAGRAAVKRG